MDSSSVNTALLLGIGIVALVTIGAFIRRSNWTGPRFALAIALAGVVLFIAWKAGLLQVVGG